MNIEQHLGSSVRTWCLTAKNWELNHQELHLDTIKVIKIVFYCKRIGFSCQRHCGIWSWDFHYQTDDLTNQSGEMINKTAGLSFGFLW